MIKKILILGAVLIVVGGAGFYLKRHFGSEETAGDAVSAESLFSVRRGDLLISITENGTLVAKESQRITPEIRGRAKIVQLVEEGKTVAEGDVICKFDTTDLDKEIEQLQLEIVKAEADTKTAQTELEIQIGDDAAKIEKAKIAIDKARKELERYVEGTAPQELTKLDVEISNTETEYNKAEKRYQDSVRLLAEKFLQLSEVEGDEIERRRREYQLKSARKQKELFEKYDYPINCKDKETAVTDAVRELDTAEKRADSSKRQKEVTLEQHQTRFTKLKDQLKEKEEQRAKMEIKAPCPGIIIYGDPRWGWTDESIKVGGEIWGSNTIMTIPDLRVMQVRIQVHEADINKIKLEQVVNVSMDTYPGLALKGQVSKIAAIAGTNNPYERDSEVKKFDVEITIEDSKDADGKPLVLKPGISAKAEIRIDERKSALHVPIQCVYLENAEHRCYVLEGAPVSRVVKPGMSNDNYLEILEGLAEGERVLLYNPNLGASTEKKKTEEPEVPASAPPMAPPSPPPMEAPAGS